MPNSDYGTAIVGTIVSGTSISFGSATVFESANSPLFHQHLTLLMEIVVIAYKDDANHYGTAIVGTDKWLVNKFWNRCGV